MLISLVVLLRPLTDGVLPKTTGRLVHAAFLNAVAQCDNRLAAELHGNQRSHTLSVPAGQIQDAVKPFSVSQLFEMTSPTRRQSSLQPGRWAISSAEKYWLRFTGFSVAVYDLLLEMERMMKREFSPLRRLRIGYMTFEVIDVTSNQAMHPWAGWNTWEDLVDSGETNAKKFKLLLHFMSPTSFRSSLRIGRANDEIELNIPLPRPSLVFQHLAKKWERHSPVEYRRLPLAIIECLGGDNDRSLIDTESVEWSILDKAVIVARLSQINTKMCEFSEGNAGESGEDGRRVGFVGEVDYDLKHLDDHGRLAAFALARFGFFAGVGDKTTMGMGLMRPISI